MDAIGIGVNKKNNHIFSTNTPFALDRTVHYFCEQATGVGKQIIPGHDTRRPVGFCCIIQSVGQLSKLRILQQSVQHAHMGTAGQHCPGSSAALALA